jgi:hypothetical protein
MKRALSALALAAALASPFACEHYESPPDVAVEGMASGVLLDARAPIVIDFGMPIDESSVHLTVAYYDTDGVGNLPDEETPPKALRVLLKHDPAASGAAGADDAGAGDTGGVATFEDGDTKLSFTPANEMPIGPKLVLLIDPGLRSKDGRERHYRTRLPFSYVVRCPPGATANNFQVGTYFLLLQVQQPIGTQIQLYGSVDVQASNGALVGQFTKAKRNPNAVCPSPCPSTQVCRLLPEPQCVVPSTAAGTVDEYSDWVPNDVLPTGFSFEVHGCVVDDGNASNMLTAPATMVVHQPAVTVDGLTMSAQFGPDPQGVVRATGSLTADSTLLGSLNLGAGSGTMTALRLADANVPPGVPQPADPPETLLADGGAP